MVLPMELEIHSHAADASFVSIGTIAHDDENVHVILMEDDDDEVTTTTSPMMTSSTSWMMSRDPSHAGRDSSSLLENTRYTLNTQTSILDLTKDDDDDDDETETDGDDASVLFEDLREANPQRLHEDAAAAAVVPVTSTSEVVAITTPSEIQFANSSSSSSSYGRRDPASPLQQRSHPQPYQQKLKNQENNNDDDDDEEVERRAFDKAKGRSMLGQLSLVHPDQFFDALCASHHSVMNTTTTTKTTTTSQLKKQRSASRSSLSCASCTPKVQHFQEELETSVPDNTTATPQAQQQQLMAVASPSEQQEQEQQQVASDIWDLLGCEDAANTTLELASIWSQPRKSSPRPHDDESDPEIRRPLRASFTYRRQKMRRLQQQYQVNTSGTTRHGKTLTTPCLDPTVSLSSSSHYARQRWTGPSHHYNSRSSSNSSRSVPTYAAAPRAAPSTKMMMETHCTNDTNPSFWTKRAVSMDHEDWQHSSSSSHHHQRTSRSTVPKPSLAQLWGLDETLPVMDLMVANSSTPTNTKTPTPNIEDGYDSDPEWSLLRSQSPIKTFETSAMEDDADRDDDIENNSDKRMRSTLADMSCTEDTHAISMDDSSTTNSGTSSEDDSHDDEEAAIYETVQQTLNSTWTLTWHPNAKNVEDFDLDSSQPTCVNIWMERGTVIAHTGVVVEPTFMWREAYQPHLHPHRRKLNPTSQKPWSTRLLNLCRIAKATKPCKEHPLVRPSQSFWLKTCQGQELLLEAASPQEVDQICQRWKLAVARFASLAVVEDIDAIAHEFFHPTLSAQTLTLANTPTSSSTTTTSSTQSVKTPSAATTKTTWEASSLEG